MRMHSTGSHLISTRLLELFRVGNRATEVHAGLELDKHLDDWLMIHPGGALDLGGTED